ncbi:hypothetical protein Q9L58_009984 [Maublancomyces gigas]|uniref:Uncharacterized protein n=1 Tax=Discina gigas TaxID=1032678 RepID=A0ABR3G5H5_9PEZI
MRRNLFLSNLGNNHQANPPKPTRSNFTPGDGSRDEDLEAEYKPTTIREIPRRKKLNESADEEERRQKRKYKSLVRSSDESEDPENQPALPTARSRYSLQTNVDNEDNLKAKWKRRSLVVWSNVESENGRGPKHPKYETTRFSASGDSSRHRDNPPTTIELCFYENESPVHPFLIGLAEISPVTEPGIPGIPSFK